jgi:hypothetical protein
MVGTDGLGLRLLLLRDDNADLNDCSEQPIDSRWRDDGLFLGAPRFAIAGTVTMDNRLEALSPETGVVVRRDVRVWERRRDGEETNIQEMN